MKALLAILLAASVSFSCTKSDPVIPKTVNESPESITIVPGRHFVGNYTNLTNHSSLGAEPETFTIRYELGSFMINYQKKFYQMHYDTTSRYLGIKQDLPCSSDQIQQMRLFDNADGTFGLYVNHYGSAECNGLVYVTSATYKKMTN